MSARRIFWGRSLAQAVAKAARHYKVAPELLAWRPYEKRHGFVRHQRAALVEVDPAAPVRAAGEGALVLSPIPVSRSTPATPAANAASSAVAALPRSSAPPAPATPPAARGAAPARPPKIVAPRNEEPLDPPDEESAAAALEAIGRLLRFAGIDARATVTRSAERLDVALVASECAADGEIGIDLLDELEHLLPKAILTLAGRRVRVAVDCGGQREARAEELRAQARELAERVRATGESQALGPLPPAERRVVHLEFESDPAIATESVGEGHRKTVRIVPRRSA